MLGTFMYSVVGVGVKSWTYSETTMKSTSKSQITNMRLYAFKLKVVNLIPSDGYNNTHNCRFFYFFRYNTKTVGKTDIVRIFTPLITLKDIDCPWMPKYKYICISYYSSLYNLIVKIGRNNMHSLSAYPSPD